MICPLLPALALFCLSLAPLAAQESYPVPEDSKPKDGVPKEELHGPFTFDNSRIFPDTTRQYGVYVPAQYDAKKPACLIVVQDGIGKARQWKLPTILDNLIHKGEVPVQIAVFVSPGVVPAADGKRQARFNRSFEYDGMGDRYARFLIEEFLPEVQKKWNISQDPNDRAIAGSSSGAICALRRAATSGGARVGSRLPQSLPSASCLSHTSSRNCFTRSSTTSRLRFQKSGSRRSKPNDFWTASSELMQPVATRKSLNCCGKSDESFASEYVPSESR